MHAQVAQATLRNALPAAHVQRLKRNQRKKKSSMTILAAIHKRTRFPYWDGSWAVDLYRGLLWFKYEEGRMPGARSWPCKLSKRRNPKSAPKEATDSTVNIHTCSNQSFYSILLLVFQGNTPEHKVATLRERSRKALERYIPKQGTAV